MFPGFPARITDTRNRFSALSGYFGSDVLWSGISHNYRDAIVFEKLHFENVFTRQQKSRIFNFLQFEESFFFRRIGMDGCPNRRYKTPFSNSFGVVWTLALFV